MLSIILLIKGADGLQSTMSSKREPHLMEINVNEGENFTLFIEENLAFGKIKTLEWVYRKTNISTGNDSILCQMETFGNFEVNKLYQAKVEKCNETHILLTNVTLKDEGYYLRKELRENTGDMESQLIFLKVLETRIRDENESSTTVPDKSDDNLWALLILVILPVLFVIIYIVYKKRAKSDVDKGPHHEKGSAKKLLGGKRRPEHINASEMKSDLEHTPDEDVNGELKSTPAIGERFEHVHTPDVRSEERIGLNDSQSLEEQITVDSENKFHYEDVPVNEDFVIISSDPQHEKENAMEHRDIIDPETMKEFTELRRAAICSVCFVEKVNQFFFPCRHVVTCANCSSSLKLCPLQDCNTIITAMFEIRFAD